MTWNQTVRLCDVREALASFLICLIMTQPSAQRGLDQRSWVLTHRQADRKKTDPFLRQPASEPFRSLTQHRKLPIADTICRRDTQLLIILVSYLLTACHKHHLQRGTPETAEEKQHIHTSHCSPYIHYALFIYLLLNSAFISAAWLAPFVGGKQYSLYTLCPFPQGGLGLIFFLIISIMYET